MKNGGVAASAHPPVVGVDVGGTKVAAAAVVGEQAENAVEHPTDLRGPHELLAGIESAIRDVLGDHAAPAAIGIGVPSQIEHATGRVMSSVNIPLAGIPLREELASRFDGVPVFVDNDANVAALAEAHSAEGTAPGERVDDLVMYTLGTGVGGGVVIGGRIYRGARGLGAELGHVVIRADGPPCQGSCPNFGCLETLCSGTALGRDATHLAHGLPGSGLAGRRDDDGKVDARDVIDLVREGDADATALLERYADNLGVGLANAVNAFEPELIVIGGGLSKAADLFLDRAWAEASRRALPALLTGVRVSVARAGAQAGVLGAGLMAAQEMERKMDTAGLTASEGVR